VKVQLSILLSYSLWSVHLLARDKQEGGGGGGGDGNMNEANRHGEKSLKGQRRGIVYLPQRFLCTLFWDFLICNIYLNTEIGLLLFGVVLSVYDSFLSHIIGLGLLFGVI